MVKLGELVHIATGGRNTSDAVENGTYPFYVRSQVPLSLNEYDFDESAVLTAGDGVGVGKVFHHVEGKYALHQRAYRLVPNLELLSSRYLYHVMVSQFGRYLESTVFHSSVTSVRKPMLERFPVAVPPMEEQDRVADVLDRFNALVNDITSGLPAEIAARRAQYEHYRDRLLSFPEKKAE
jgi:type I restriction enzyme specificity protein hsdS